MDLEKLQELADSDLKINDVELDLESLKTPQLHNKYMKHLTKFKLMLSRAEGDLYIPKENFGNIIQVKLMPQCMHKNLSTLNY